MEIAVQAFREMSDLFTEAGLGVPPIPHRFRADLFRVASWAYATRAIEPMEMYMFYPQPARELNVMDDYVAVSHAGHGVNSYAITYHLVSGPLALFAQAAWGGLLMDEETTAEVRRMFAACARLADAAERLGPGRRRLIVAESNFRGTRGYCRIGPDLAAGERLKLQRDIPADDRPFGFLDAAQQLITGS